jgi:hypothetical protein
MNPGSDSTVGSPTRAVEQYEAPTLIRYGPLVSLTTSGSGPLPENTGEDAANNAKRHP